MNSAPFRISGALRARLAALRLKEGTEAQKVRAIFGLGLDVAEEIQRRAMVPKEVMP
jgi:hypothetical protein